MTPLDLAIYVAAVVFCLAYRAGWPDDFDEENAEK